MAPLVEKQNVTVSLSRQTIRKAKILAAKRETSISKMVADQIDALISQDDEYESAKRSALAIMKKGFPMDGIITATRDELHER